MININTLNFNLGTPSLLKKKKFGKNWPTVYIINNKDEAYIGETTDASIRSNQHLANEAKRRLNKISVIGDETFNKSSILDLESFLIKYMSADNVFKLQNGNAGLQNHNYYQKEMYEKKFKEIWVQLKSKGLVKNDLRVIENSDLFKYSPYKSLTIDQYMIVNDILSVLASDVKDNKQSTFVVNGGAGTGKTILGIYLMKLLTEVQKDKMIIEEDQVEKDLNDIINLRETVDDLKIGLVIPMDNLRQTLKKVFRRINGLNANMVLSPNDVAKSEFSFDLLIIDEAHRLRQRKNLTQYASFDKNNSKFNLGKQGTELDWILLKSRYQIFFYDESQSIKLTDIPKEKFQQMYFSKNYHPYFLETQLRCMKGGTEYIDYVKAIFSNKPPKRSIHFKEYDFKIFDDVNEMIKVIKEKDAEYGLCRNIAGYSWAWKSKGKKLPMHITERDLEKIIKDGSFDIEIKGYKYIWNTQASDWINSPNSINEIGSIHTTQGFDLNYTGLIIGNELKYDKENKKIIVDRNCYFDIKGKASTADEQLLEYILNIYKTMCTRGILGTYLYICDDNLREYMKEFVNEY